MSAEPVTCPNCGAVCHELYCARCGQKRIHEGDLSLRHAWHHVLHEVLHLDGRFFSTMKTLLGRPGQLTVDFTEGRRAQHMSPIGLFLALGTVYFMFAATWMGTLLDLKAVMNQSRNPKITALVERRAAAAGMSVEAYASYRNEKLSGFYKPIHIVALLTGGLWLSVLFRGKRRYLAEHMVFVLHTGSFGFVVAAAFGWAIPRHRSLTVVLSLIGITYVVLAARRVYGGSWGVLVAKAVALRLLETAVTTLALGAAFLRGVLF
jgi:uncharacterized protein DUF3667